MSVRPHLVIAEDQKELRALLQRQLEGAGYQVTACPDGTSALESIKSFKPNLIIADWMMPGLDGLELCRHVRSLCESHAIEFTYVILLTSNGEKHQVVSGLEAGADDYLTKPYHTQELLARVRGGLRLSELQRKLTKRNTELQRTHEEVLALNRRLEDIANIDDLTGLCSRRRFFERLDEVWNQAHRENLQCGCIMIDVDHFKRVNDAHGHAIGDVVLKSLAQICRRAMRSYDLIGRYGGEEFCALLFPSDWNSAAILAERMRGVIENSPLTIEDQQFHLTASFGVAMLTQRHESPRELLAEADALLYLAKQNGRNQVWVKNADGGTQRYARELSAAV